ncbi:MAG: hypothetical protein ABI091_06680 [Ferruginibacter sp.]
MAALIYTIVEDSIKVCNGIKERMDDFPNWKCCGFIHHANDVIKEIERFRPQLIYIDWALKGGSAFEVLSDISSLLEYNPYIIFNTGYQAENPEIPQDIINNYKIDKYLVKPLWENLRLHLPEYLKEAEQRSTHPVQELNRVWLTDITRKHHQVNMNSIVCILQDFENPYFKVIILDDRTSLTLKVSWAKIAELLETYKINSFVTNSREHIIVKGHVQFYKRPYVSLHHFKHKIEVVKNKLAAFEEWMAKS